MYTFLPLPRSDSSWNLESETLTQRQLTETSNGDRGVVELVARTELRHLAAT